MWTHSACSVSDGRSAAGRAVLVPLVFCSFFAAQAALAADKPAAPLTVRVAGTIGATETATLYAPRIAGSRDGLNRGGGAQTAGVNAAGVSDAPSDFTLTLLKLAEAGSHVKAGDIVAQFDAQNQVQRVEDYGDSTIQLAASFKAQIASITADTESDAENVTETQADVDSALLDGRKAEVMSAIDAAEQKLDQEEADAVYAEAITQHALLQESNSAQIRTAQLTAGAAKLELARAENNVKTMTFRAPIDGVVVMATTIRNGEAGQIREGDTVGSGQPFLYVVDMNSMVVNSFVNQVDAEKVKLGMKAEIHIDAYPDLKFEGNVVGIGALSSASGMRASYVSSIPVRIAIDGQDPRVVPDLSASVDILLQ